MPSSWRTAANPGSTLLIIYFSSEVSFKVLRKCVDKADKMELVGALNVIFMLLGLVL